MLAILRALRLLRPLSAAALALLTLHLVSFGAVSTAKLGITDDIGDRMEKGGVHMANTP
jgi:hypothetical protein